MGGNLEIYATNKLYDINIYCLYDILDIRFDTLYYKFCFKFCEEQNLEKDLCIINKTNCHYRLLFSKKHKVTKINNILLFNQNILYKSNSNIVNNNKTNSNIHYNITNYNNISISKSNQYEKYNNTFKNKDKHKNNNKELFENNQKIIQNIK